MVIMNKAHTMKTVPITEFKAHCLRLVDEVAKTGVGFVITKRGKPQAQICPAPPAHDTNDYAPGKSAHTARIIGDIMAPIDVEWDAMK
jgi:prevent-host-death family protein